MTVEEKASGRRRIGDVLVEQGVLTSAKLETALNAQRQTPPGVRRQRLGAIIVGLGFATERQSARALAAALNLTLADLGRTTADAATVRLLPRAMAERHECLVLAFDGRRIRVATSDPTNVVAIDDIKLHTGATEVVLEVATASQIRQGLGRAWSLANDSARSFPSPTWRRTSRTRRRPRALMPPRWCGWSMQCSATRCGPGPATSTSSRSSRMCGCATGSTVSCAR